MRLTAVISRFIPARIYPISGRSILRFWLCPTDPPTGWVTSTVLWDGSTPIMTAITLVSSITGLMAGKAMTRSLMKYMKRII